MDEPIWRKPGTSPCPATDPGHLKGASALGPAGSSRCQIPLMSGSPSWRIYLLPARAELALLWRGHRDLGVWSRKPPGCAELLPRLLESSSDPVLPSGARGLWAGAHTVAWAQLCSLLAGRQGHLPAEKSAALSRAPREGRGPVCMGGRLWLGLAAATVGGSSRQGWGDLPVGAVLPTGLTGSWEPGQHLSGARGLGAGASSPHACEREKGKARSGTCAGRVCVCVGRRWE